MIWQAIPNTPSGGDYDVDYYSFSFSDPAMGGITPQVTYMQGLSR